MKQSIGRRLSWLVALLLLSLLAVPVVQGVDLIGTGPDFAMSPSGEWVTIEPGQYHWYIFNYKYDKDKGPMEVRLEATPVNAVRFTMRNVNQANLWRRDGTHEWFGCCSGSARDANKDGTPDYRTWSGSIGGSGTYYIVVQRDASATGPASYLLNLSGAGYSFTGAAQPQVDEAVVEVAPAPVEAKPVEPVALAGTGPDNAIALPTGKQASFEGQVIEKGEYRWYYFDHTRDQKVANEDLQAIEIKVFSDPADIARVTIRNADDAAAWERDGTQQSFGACTCVGEDKNKDGKPDYAVWKGALPSSGRYYVVVEHSRNSDTPAAFRFEVAGM